MNTQQSQLRRQRLEQLLNEVGGGFVQHLNEVALERAIIEIKKPYRGLTLKPTHVIWPLEVSGPMHCEHIATFYASRRRLKGVRYDAFNKMHREYRKAARDADYAATFWRA